jgi:hypothetical protein
MEIQERFNKRNAPVIEATAGTSVFIDGNLEPLQPMVDLFFKAENSNRCLHATLSRQEAALLGNSLLASVSRAIELENDV